MVVGVVEGVAAAPLNDSAVRLFSLLPVSSIKQPEARANSQGVIDASAKGPEPRAENAETPRKRQGEARHEKGGFQKGPPFVFPRSLYESPADGPCTRARHLNPCPGRYARGMASAC